MTRQAHDFVVVGGGIVGGAIGEGLARRGRDVAILDEGDVAFRAARGNLGHVWVQGKGAGNPAYADLTRKSAREWRAMADRLLRKTGIDVRFEQRGAILPCHSEADMEKRASTLALTATGARIDCPYTMLDHDGVARLLPAVGPEVVGGSHCDADGAVNPLHLLRALIASTVLHGGAYHPFCGVSDLRAETDGFSIATDDRTFHARHIVLCAGLGNGRLAPQLGMFGDIRPVRGQILVTERLRPFLPVNVSFIRQTTEGSCMIGESSEEAGFDAGTTVRILKDTAERAIRTFPRLRHARIVRAWGALRIMTPDGAPVYQMKGFGKDAAHKATAISVHSGVTLCAYHCNDMAAQVAAGALEPEIASAFGAERFDV